MFLRRTKNMRRMSLRKALFCLEEKEMTRLLRDRDVFLI